MQEVLRKARILLDLEIAAVGPYLPRDPMPVRQHEDAKPKTSAPPTEPIPTMPDRTLLNTGDGAPSPDRLSALIPVDSPILSCGSLDELAAFVANTRLIPLDHTRTNPVFGVGNPAAELMVVGEAPGADEDLKGEPFVGRAGQLLDKILEATGFSRQTVYIANILKSRPPNNRDPQPEEIAAHAPILYRQISLIQPRIILTVGRVSACTLLGRQASLASLRGKVHDFHGIPLVATYHPAALLRNPQWKRPTWEDMKFLRSQFDRLIAGV